MKIDGWTSSCKEVQTEFSYDLSLSSGSRNPLVWVIVFYPVKPASFISFLRTYPSFFTLGPLRGKHLAECLREGGQTGSLPDQSLVT